MPAGFHQASGFEYRGTGFTPGTVEGVTVPGVVQGFNVPRRHWSKYSDATGRTVAANPDEHRGFPAFMLIISEVLL